MSNNIIQFPATTANPSSSNMEPTDGDLASYAQRKLDEVRDRSPDTKLTLELLLSRPAIRAALVKQWQADQVLRRAEEAAALEAELKAIEAELNPLPVIVPARSVKVQVIEPEIPLQVERCRERMVGLLLSCVFETAEAAAAMRFHLIKFIKPTQDLVKREQPDQHPLYVQRLRDRVVYIQGLINLINQVIVAWGENPKVYAAGGQMIGHVRTLLEADPQFHCLWNPPSLEEIWEEERRQATEVERRERHKALGLTIRGLLVQAGGNLGSIDKMVERLVRKFDNLEDPQLILKAAAVEKVIETKNANDPVAKLYAKAAGLSEEDLVGAVVEKKALPLIQPKSPKKTQQEKQAARAAADNAARPKPNQGSGDSRHWKKGKK